MKGLNLLLVVALGIGISGCAKSGGSKNNNKVAGGGAQCAGFQPTAEVGALGGGNISGLWSGSGILEDGLASESCSQVHFEIFQNSEKIRINKAQFQCATRCLTWGASEFEIRGSEIFLQNKKVGDVVSPNVFNIQFNVGTTTHYNLLFKRVGNDLVVKELREYAVNRKRSYFASTSELKKIR